jgi:hypothetical protein
VQGVDQPPSGVPELELEPEPEPVVVAMPYAVAPAVVLELDAALDVCATPYAAAEPELELVVAAEPPSPPPEVLLLHDAPMAAAVAVVSPRSMATAARGKLPSLRRRGSPQLGHVDSVLLA